MNHSQTRNLAALAALALLVSGGLLVAGPLDPPAGPITSTYKTLTEVEPRIAVNATNTPGDADSLFKITQPGSYYLTGNITGVAGKHGIEIEAGNVTLDLNGFELAGVPGMGVYAGVACMVVGCDHIEIVNGSVRAWGAGGIYLAGSMNSRVAGVRVSNNAGDGIRVTHHCTVTGCTVDGNQADGIESLFSSTVTDCTVTNSSDDGINVGLGSTVLRCSVKYSGGEGIVTGDESVVANCALLLNSDNGIRTGSGCTVTECTSGHNYRGVVVGLGCTITGCTAMSSAHRGIETGADCTVADCTAHDSRGSTGINVGAGSTVSGCTSGGNVGDGIVASSNCQIRANTCAGNGVNPGSSANIYLSGTLNRVEDNVCTGADVGIMTVGTRNVFLRNTCGGNTTNWSIVAGNYGLVVNTSTTTAISGNSGGATIHADANANLSY